MEFSLDARPVLTVFYDRSSRVVLSPAGQVGRTTPAPTFIQPSATLRHTGRGWVVIDLTDVEPIT